MKTHIVARIIPYFRRRFIWIGFLIVLIIILVHKTSRSDRFNKLVVFGDSFSDTHYDYRLQNHALPSISGSGRRRYCDGPIWVDRLRVSEKYAYAYGGAITDNNAVRNSTKPRTFGVPGVGQQIIMYLEDAIEHKFDIRSAVYIIWIGYNDFAIDASVDPKSVVKSLIDSIEYLISIRAKNFVVFNQAPFQSVPIYFQLNRAEFYTQLTNSFNRELEDGLAALQIRQPNASISMFDNHALITKILSGKLSTAFTNTLQECRAYHGEQAAKILCADPEQFPFYDRIHFSSVIHQAISNAIQPFFSSTFKENMTDSYFRSFNQ